MIFLDDSGKRASEETRRALESVQRALAGTSAPPRYLGPVVVVVRGPDMRLFPAGPLLSALRAEPDGAAVADALERVVNLAWEAPSAVAVAVKCENGTWSLARMHWLHMAPGGAA